MRGTGTMTVFDTGTIPYVNVLYRPMTDTATYMLSNHLSTSSGTSFAPRIVFISRPECFCSSFFRARWLVEEEMSTVGF